MGWRTRVPLIRSPLLYWLSLEVKRELTGRISVDIRGRVDNSGTEAILAHGGQNCFWTMESSEIIWQAGNYSYMYCISYWTFVVLSGTEMTDHMVKILDFAGVTFFIKEIPPTYWQNYCAFALGYSERLRKTTVVLETGTKWLSTTLFASMKVNSWIAS